MGWSSKWELPCPKAPDSPGGVKKHHLGGRPGPPLNITHPPQEIHETGWFIYLHEWVMFMGNVWKCDLPKMNGYVPLPMLLMLQKSVGCKNKRRKWDKLATWTGFCRISEPSTASMDYMETLQMILLIRLFLSRPSFSGGRKNVCFFSVWFLLPKILELL